MKTAMEERRLSDLTDQELLQEAKKMKTNSITNAVLIGFLIGVIIYSIVKSTFGFLAIIPLFLAYKLINNSKYKNTELEMLLKERNLK
ncbi:MAG TPA: FUSC family protein [Chryseolinea sp.]|nr:FUSC family protein [Chryseolinea sp.]